MAAAAPPSSVASFTVRAATPADAAGFGKGLQDAFGAFNESVGLPPEFEKLEVAIHVAEWPFKQRTFRSFVAVDEKEQVIGGAMINLGIWAHPIGPVFASPQAANGGVARAVTSAVIDAAKANGAQSIRLLQTCHNTKSFSLYCKLGLNPRECITACIGQLKDTSDADNDSYSARPLDPSDIPACDNLHMRATGFSRGQGGMEWELGMDMGAMVVTKDGSSQIVAYTTGLGVMGHLVAESDEAFKFLVASSARARASSELRVLLPAKQHPELMRWLLKVGLRVLK
eukprot:jgi/Chlat1/8373/Chrsp80S00637